MYIHAYIYQVICKICKAKCNIWKIIYKYPTKKVKRIMPQVYLCLDPAAVQVAKTDTTLIVLPWLRPHMAVYTTDTTPSQHTMSLPYLIWMTCQSSLPSKGTSWPGPVAVAAKQTYDPNKWEITTMLWSSCQNKIAIGSIWLLDCVSILCIDHFFLCWDYGGIIYRYILRQIMYT